MSAFARFLRSLFATPATAGKLASKRERAYARLMRKRWQDTEEKLYWQSRQLAEKDKRLLEIEADLATVRMELGQRVAAGECEKIQIELLTTVIAGYQAKEEAAAAIHQTRKSTAVERALKRQDE